MSSSRTWEYGFSAVFVIVNGYPQDLLGNGERLVFIELDVSCTLDLDLGRGGDDLGMEIGSQLYKRLHHTLNVHNHGFHSTGQDSQFLVQEVAGGWDTLAH
jgi:hypothetical protein